MPAIVHRTAKPPAPLRQPAQFMQHWSAQLRELAPDAVMDFSFKDDAVVIVDMRIPSVQRRGVLYTSDEIRNKLDDVEGDFEKRVAAFMAKG